MARRDKYESGDTITWLQVHNLLPIVGIIVAAIGVFNLLSNKVELQNQQISYLSDAVNSCLARTGSVEDRVDIVTLDVKELQTKTSVKGASTVNIERPRITPDPVPTAVPNP